MGQFSTNFGTNASEMYPSPRLRDVTGRTKITAHQNIFEADFEYGTQPLRWQSFTTGAGVIVSSPGSGGVSMSITTSSSDIAIRQSRPYHRYQPGKTMYMATAVNFGGAVTNQRQRVGFFDDGNGIFWQQGDPNANNPSGMYCVYRSDVNQIPTDTVIDFANWTDQDNIKNTINWSLLQMLYIEYAWYGAGGLRWGIIIDGEPHILHHIPTGNSLSVPWCRTGNLPVRYELRNVGSVSASAQMYHYGVSVLVDGGQDPQRGFTYSYGMALGTPTRTVATSTTRYPLMSVQFRTMGTQEFTNKSAPITGTPTTTSMTVASLPSISSISVTGTTATVTFSSAHGIVAETSPIQNYITISGATPSALNGYWPVTVTSTTVVTFTVPSGTASATVVGTATPWSTNQWVGRYVFFQGTGTQGQGAIGRIIANTTNTLTYQDNIQSSYNATTGNVVVPISTAPVSGAAYTIGLIDRGLILPRQLTISSTAICQVELISSTPSSPIVLTGASFVALNTINSPDSFALRDVSATSMTGGETVMKFTAPAGGSGLQIFDLTNLFPLYNVIQGNLPDILTVAVTTSSAGSAAVGADIIGQEQMS